jgi:phenylpyruvate tautomerase PptA (4-oxalocrotonate tautomerase family)
MPLIRISLLKGKSPQYLRALSDGIHEALTKTYNVPAADRFHLIHQHEPHEFIYDAEYLGVHRTDDVVFIHITAGNWRDTATKKLLYARLVERLAQSPGLRPEDVQVVIASNERDEWSFGKGIASYVKDSGTA